MTPKDLLLPIKVVIQKEGEHARIERKGGGKKPIVGGQLPDKERRDSLAGEILAVREYFAQAWSALGDVPCVAKVRLKREAIAKTHRPKDLFNNGTCPVLGVGDSQTLFVSATPDGLTAVASLVSENQKHDTIADISALELISPWTPVDSMGGESGKTILKEVGDRKQKSIRVQLFQHSSSFHNKSLEHLFLKHLQSLEIESIERLDYGNRQVVYSVMPINEDQVVSIASFPGTKNVAPFPDYETVRTQSIPIGTVAAKEFPPPTQMHYPTVGLIDTGTDVSNAMLQEWVVDRISVVPENMQNNEHGSFVAGLLINGRSLNHNDPRFPSTSVRIVDVVAVDKTGSISEYDLLTIIKAAVTKHRDVKVWNLSLGMQRQCCEMDRFSSLAVALDELADENGIVFIVPSGNHSFNRTYPPQSGIGDHDRICPPADALRAITVGSIAHQDNASSCVRRDQPSPFSRRGPAPSYSPKPEVIHIGGNCDAFGRYMQTGVISLNANGQLAESVGTSFSVPLVASLTAHVHQELQSDAELNSSLAAKALIIHSAFLRGAPKSASEFNYLGAGMPGDLDEIISCKQSSATMIIHAPVAAKHEVLKQNFPFPQSLLKNAEEIRGEVFMTVLHDAPMDRAFGAEYCRSHISATLGTTNFNERKQKNVYKRQVPPVPKGVTRGSESSLIRDGFKWSPFKLYYREFSPRCRPAGQWRLKLSRLDRAEYLIPMPQNAVIIVTIRDPMGQVNVYDEMVREMQNQAWIVRDISIRSRARFKA